MLQTFKKHWIIFRKLDTIISIHVNLPPDKITKDQNKEQVFKQDLTKDRPYLIIEEDEENLLILTLTTNSEEEIEENKKDKEDKPSFRKFGSIKCDCLDFDTYAILDTKIFASWEFVRKFPLNLDSKLKHQCLPPEQFLELMENLGTYWNRANRKLISIELGTNPEPKKRRKIKRKSIPLFY